MGEYKNRSRLANLGSSNFDTRHLFEETLTDAGHLYIARVVDLTLRCSCIINRDDRYREPDPDCKLCDDMGYLYNDKEILAYKAYEHGPEQAATPERMRADIICIYMRHDVFESRQQGEYSRIMELKMDDEGVIDPRKVIVAKFNIKDAIPYREKGRLIYWKIIVHRKDI